MAARPRGRDARRHRPRQRTASKATSSAGGTQAPDGEQALHARSTATEEDPEADRSRADPERSRSAGRRRAGRRTVSAARAVSGRFDEQRGTQQLQARRPGAAPASGRSAPPPAPAAPRPRSPSRSPSSRSRAAAAAGRAGAWRPASISASRNDDARCTSGSRASVICVAAGGPSRPTSRSSPSSSGWRAARRKTERTTASTRSQPSPAPLQRRLERGGEVGGAAGDHRLEQGVLGGEPVQDRLLGELELLGDGVERGRLVAPAGERGQGGVEDAVAGGGGAEMALVEELGHLPNGRQNRRAGGRHF